MIIFTDHAKKRCQERGFDTLTLREKFKDAVRLYPPHKYHSEMYRHYRVENAHMVVAYYPRRRVVVTVYPVNYYLRSLEMSDMLK